MNLYLLKPGELTLKKGNRKFFEKKLRSNIRRTLKDPAIQVWGTKGRMYLSAPEEKDSYVRRVLAHTPGLHGFTLTVGAEKEIDAIRKTALKLAMEIRETIPDGSFKVAVRRADKSFPMHSYELACNLGELILENCPWYRVNVHNPDWILHVEIREKAFMYNRQTDCVGGLPVGVGGRATLLLSGGIDSPVAGFMMAKRGLKIDAVYFHTYPYTSDESRDKVVDLARKLADWTVGLRLFVVPFTEVQLHIQKNARSEEITLLSRASMMAIAEKISFMRHNVCLITGESLGQVASQTPESMRFTQNELSLPVFRPLVGMDKEQIITIARKIKTFETSILPYDDCCTIFAPEHPLVRPDLDRMKDAYAHLNHAEMLEKAALSAEVTDLTPFEGS